MRECSSRTLASLLLMFAAVYCVALLASVAYSLRSVGLFGATDRRVALLLWGRLRAFDVCGDSVARVAQRYNADVFAATQHDAMPHQLRQVFADRLRALHLLRQPTQEEVSALFDHAQMPDEQFIKQLKTSNAFGPWGNAGSFGFMMMYYQQRALEAMEAFEEARGIRYDWVLSVRPDSMFVRDPPPLEMLNASCAYSHDGQSFMGINDRFAIVPRWLATPFFGRLSKLRFGGYERAYVRANWKDRTHVRYKDSSERSLYNMIVGSGGCWGRFRAVMYIHCPTNEQRECSPNHPCNAQSACAKRNDGIPGKFLEEYQLAMKEKDRGWKKETDVMAPYVPRMQNSEWRKSVFSDG